MGARFHVLCVGRSRCDWAGAAVADYTKRIGRMGGVAEVAVRQEPFKGDVAAVQAAEAERLLAAVPNRGRLVALDERGERLDTEGFAALVREGRDQGPVAFALGGPYGHGAAARDRAWRTVRLSDLVLNHEVARVLLYEQLYRALTVIEGIPYHH
ncbi:MAG: 23S rRNA (pseudouridine(1915)-N(3))-methyltransferase RlmH [Myxococcota bacterium]